LLAAAMSAPAMLLSAAAAGDNKRRIGDSEESERVKLMKRGLVDPSRATAGEKMTETYHAKLEVIRELLQKALGVDSSSITVTLNGHCPSTIYMS